MKTYQQTLEKLKLKQERQLLKAQFKIEKLKKKIKQKSIHELKDELSKLTHKIVRTQSNVCYTCDKYLSEKDREAGHHWSQGGHGAVRFDFDNIRVQCNKCNWRESGNQNEFAYRLRRELGDERYEDLYKRKGKTKKWSRDELERMIADRKEQFKELL